MTSGEGKALSRSFPPVLTTERVSMAEDKWDDEFKKIVANVEMEPVSNADINRVIWRLNEASLYLSRYMQYSLCDHAYPFPENILDYLKQLSALSAEISRAIEAAEPDVHELSDGSDENCLECIENQMLGWWGPHDTEAIGDDSE